MSPTTDELIKEYLEEKRTAIKGEFNVSFQRVVYRLKGRLDVLEEWLPVMSKTFQDYHLDIIEEEIAKIKVVLS